MKIKWRLILFLIPLFWLRLLAHKLGFYKPYPYRPFKPSDR